MPTQMLALVPNWIGDVAMVTPALRALHHRFPDAELAVAGREAACQLLRGLPYIDHFHTLPARPGARALAACAWRLRPAARDLCVVFPHAFRAALLARLSGARRVTGYARDARTFLLTDAVPPHRENGKIAPVYMAREYLDLVARLGCEDDSQGLALAAGPDELAFLDTWWPAGPVVGLAPGAAFGPSKRWPAERFAETARLLEERAGASAVLLTGPGEEEIHDAVRAVGGTTLHDPYQGKPSIARLKAVTSRLDLLICNDSGPRHVAIAFGRPVICIMGPTSPRYTQSPWEKGEVIRIDVDCGPCQKPVCTTDHRCMTQITPEQVAEAAVRWLEQP